MKILLDTQAFIWLATDDKSLSQKARKLFLDEKNDFFLSLASVWEMAIKSSLGKLILKQSLDKLILSQLQENYIDQLTISFRHVTRVKKLPFHHRDPFDRLLIAQAIEEDIPVLTADAAFDQYKIKRLW